MKVLLLLGITALTACTATALADDVSDLLTEAQRAYVRGETKAAKEKFETVLKMEPQNRLANQYMRRILAEQLKELQTRGPSNATEATLKTVILPKVQFAEASLADTLEYIRQKGNQVAEGKASINFVMQLDEATKVKKVTLALQNVPITEVLRYLGQLADVEFVYDPFAIVVRPKSNAPAGTAQPASGPAAGGVKIEGL